MNDRDLQIVLASFKARHPDTLPHLKALAATQGTTVAASATPIMQLLLDQHDEICQLKWAMRNMLKRVKRGDGTHYLALGPNASTLVYLLAMYGEMDMRETTYYSAVQPAEIQNWKNVNE